MTEVMTIADALTELKRIKKVLDKRNANIYRYSSKRRGSKDEIENQLNFVKSEFKSAQDLIERYKQIKLLINQSNLVTGLEFKTLVFSVADAILFKQQFHEMYEALYNSFSPSTGNNQVQMYSRMLSGSNLTQEQLEKLDMVPELFYDEAEMLKNKEKNLDLYSFVDGLIEKSNHATNITLS